MHETLIILSFLYICIFNKITFLLAWLVTLGCKFKSWPDRCVVSLRKTLLTINYAPAIARNYFWLWTLPLCRPFIEANTLFSSSLWHGWNCWTIHWRKKRRRGDIGWKGRTKVYAVQEQMGSFYFYRLTRIGKLKVPTLELGGTFKRLRYTSL